jgi:hypothetical protein
MRGIILIHDCCCIKPYYFIHFSLPFLRLSQITENDFGIKFNTVWTAMSKINITLPWLDSRRKFHRSPAYLPCSEEKVASCERVPCFINSLQNWCAGWWTVV